MDAVLQSGEDFSQEVGVWGLVWQRFRRDRVGMVSLVVVLIFVIIALASATGVMASDWSEEVGTSNAPPEFLSKNLAAPGATEATGPAARITPTESSISDPLSGDLAEIRGEVTATPNPDISDPLADVLAEIKREAKSSSAAKARQSDHLLFGADKWGRDVFKKTIKGTQVSLLVGMASAALATLIGTLFGAIAGYYGGKRDDFFNWLYSVFTSIPYLLLVLAIAAVLNRRGPDTVILILALTGWTGIFRLVRAEYLKHRVREYVLAADAIGASHLRRVFVHILPNVSHVVLVQLSLHVVLFIKSEVVLSFLGFGVGVDTVSWGSMLNEAQSELLLGYWWQMAAATLFMAVLVTAFSLFTDALRDTLDPKLQ